MTTTDEQTLADLEHGLAEAQDLVRIAEGLLARRRAELVEAEAAEGAARAAKDAYADEYTRIMAVSRQPGEVPLVNDQMWRARYPAGAAAAGRMQALEQARQKAAGSVTNLSNGVDGAITRAEQWLAHCRAEVDRWEGLRTQHEAAQASERAKRAQGWRPTLDQLAARLKAR